MGFFSTLSSIASNGGNFKRWEQEERDNDAKRKELYKRGVGKDRLDNAKKRGDVIIDVVTQMDQHSENMAEDIEQVTEPLTSLSLGVGTLGGMALGGYMWYKHAEKDVKDFDEATLKLSEEVRAKIYEETKNYNYETQKEEIHKLHRLARQTWGNLYKEKTYSNYEKYLTDTQKKTIKNELIPQRSKIFKNMKKWGWIGGAVAVAIPATAFTLTTLGTTKMQLDGSRIARWQSRNQLKDARNFVIYTPEQIKEAEDKVEKNKKPLTLKEKMFGKKDKNYSGFWKNWYRFFADRKAYNQWKAQDTDDSKKITRQLSEKEIQEAKLDKELIQRMTKKINNKAEQYSEDMETASGVVLSLPIVTGPLIGLPMSWILEKTGIAKKIGDKILKNNAPKEYLELLATQAKEDRGRCKKAIDFLGNIDKLSNMIKEENIAKGIKIDNQHKFANFKRMAKVLAAQTSGTRKLINMGIVFVATTIATMYVGLKLQKNAARAGRYVAREEFRENPQELLSYTDDEMKQVENVKGTKPTLGEKFKGWITFIPTCIKNMYKYENYKKHTYQKQRDVREELIKSAKVSDEQMQEAKNLQRKLFNTFEKVDENSQNYSESMEAANQLAMPVIYTAGTGLMVAPVIALIVGVAKGKISLSKLSEWMVGGLTKISSTKFAQRVQKEGMSSLAKAIKEEETKVNVPQLASVSGYYSTIQKFLNSPIKDMVKKYQTKFGISNEILKSKTYGDLFKEYLSGNEKAVQYLNTANIPLDDVVDGTKLINHLKKYAKEHVNLNKLLTKFDLGRLEGEGINNETIKIIEERLADNPDLGKILSDLGIDIETTSVESIREQLQKYMESHEAVTKLFSKIGLINESGELTSSIIETKAIGLLDKIFKKKLPANLEKLNEFKAEQSIMDTIKPKAKEILSGIQPHLPTRETVFSKLRGAIELMPEKWVQETLGKMSNKSFGPIQSGKFDKKYAIRMLNRLEKFMEKSANSGLADEVNKVLKTMMENPEKTMALLINHPEKLFNAMKSPTLAGGLLAAGITWTAFTTLMTYLLASYFASMQKDAGRLGVMKAIESLDDYKYYADEIPDKKPTETVTQITNKPELLLNTSFKFPSTNYLYKKAG